MLLEDLLAHFFRSSFFYQDSAKKDVVVVSLGGNKTMKTGSFQDASCHKSGRIFSNSRKQTVHL